MTSNRNIITDKLLIEKTKKDLEYWYKKLDEKSADKKSHEEIFRLISGIKGLKILGEWNHNLLATSYEWSRGIKQRGQRDNGFEISTAKTINAPASELFNCWTDDKLRQRWLKEKIIFRKTTKDRSARITWADMKTSLSVEFYDKGENKSQVVVQHQKIDSREKADDLKEFWSKKLTDLKKILEKQVS
jgi:hypothetical protein